MPAVPCAGCQLAGPWLAQVGSTGFSWKSGRFSAHFLLMLWSISSQGCAPFCLLECCCGASFEESCSLWCSLSCFIYGWWMLFKSTIAWKNLGISAPLFHRWGVNSLPDPGCPVLALQSPIIPVKRRQKNPSMWIQQVCVSYFKVLCMGDAHIHPRDKLFAPFPMELLIPCGCLGSLRCLAVFPVSSRQG